VFPFTIKDGLQKTGYARTLRGGVSGMSQIVNAAMTRPIIFYDGECGICNASVDLVLGADTDEQFLFAPLQGETAARALPPLTDKPEEWSLILLDDHGIHDRSDAALGICARLGAPYNLVSSLRIIPRPIRDGVYRFIAHNRYHWFGRHETCRIPTASERARFLR
jgi:predicted DCC family thiol-disulfide oxidoreductase YuxK